MIQELFDKHILIYVMFGFCGFGVFLKLILSACYSRLVRASDQMGTSENKLMKVLKMKFETSYKLKIGVSNVDTFVDKYVLKHKIVGIHLYTWENFGVQLMILCMLTGTIGAVLGVVYDCGKNNILSTLFVGVFTSGVLIAFENFINLHTKRNIVRVNIRDYLENFLKVRLENEVFHPEEMEKYRKEYFVEEKKKDPTDEIAQDVVNKIMNSMDMTVVMETMEEAVMSNDKKSRKKQVKADKLDEIVMKEQKIIEEVLQEYLV